MGVCSYLVPVAGCDLACRGTIGPEHRGNILVEEGRREEREVCSQPFTDSQKTIRDISHQPMQCAVQ
ncbi:Interleukin-4, partial [Dissostichus eleginoides]